MAALFKQIFAIIAIGSAMCSQSNDQMADMRRYGPSAIKSAYYDNYANEPPSKFKGLGHKFKIKSAKPVQIYDQSYQQQPAPVVQPYYYQQPSIKQILSAKLKKGINNLKGHNIKSGPFANNYSNYGAQYGTYYPSTTYGTNNYKYKGKGYLTTAGAFDHYRGPYYRGWTPTIGPNGGVLYNNLVSSTTNDAFPPFYGLSYSPASSSYTSSSY